jgi:DNA-binding NarL/FixJ family response regulator
MRFVTASTVPEQAERSALGTIRVVLDGHEILRQGLRAIFASQPGFEVVGEAGPSDDLLQLVEHARPDVVLLHPRTSTMSGAEACAELVQRHPGLRILIVSTYADIDLVRACIAAGAHGYVIKQIDGAGLLQAVRDLHHRELAVSSAVASTIIDQMRSLVRVRTNSADWRSLASLLAVPPGDDPPASEFLPGLPHLTSREQEVLTRLLDGQRVASIAAELFVSQSTVRNHLSAIFRKVGVHSQAALLRRLRST